jgi:hypothetical protein
VRGIQIISAQGTQFLTPQPGIVGKSEHHAVADGFFTSNTQDGLPLFIVGNPRKLGVARNESFLALAAEALACRVASPTDGIALALAFLDQVVVEEPDRGEALLQGRIGESHPRIEDTHPLPARIGTRGQVMHILGEMFLGRGFRHNLVTVAEREVVAQRTAIRSDGVGGQAEIPLNLEPRLRRWRLCKERVALPWDFCHGQLLSTSTDRFFLHVPRLGST